MENTIRINFKARNNLLLIKREELGLTQLKMAELCDVPVSIYGAIERLDYRTSGIAGEHLKKISDTLEIEFDKLFPHWVPAIGDIINSPNNYLLLDDEYARQRLTAMDEFGASPKLLQESFAGDLETIMNEVLTERQSEIIKYFFGICGYELLPIQEIADKFNLTRERIRQIKEKALRNMRRSTNTRLLKSYFESQFE